MVQSKVRPSISANVARVLREERLKRALSMTEVAARAGLSQQMVSYVEREMRSPTLDTLLRLAEALDIDVAEILDRAVQAAKRASSS